MYIAAGVTTVLVLIILALVKPYKKRFSRVNKHQQIELVVNRDQASLKSIEDVYKEYQVNLSQITFYQTDEPETEIIQINFYSTDKAASLISIIESFKALQGIKEVKINFS